MTVGTGLDRVGLDVGGRKVGIRVGKAVGIVGRLGETVGALQVVGSVGWSS